MPDKLKIVRFNKTDAEDLVIMTTSPCRSKKIRRTLLYFEGTCYIIIIQPKREGEENG